MCPLSLQPIVSTSSRKEVRRSNTSAEAAAAAAGAGVGRGGRDRPGFIASSSVDADTPLNKRAGKGTRN